MQDVMIAEQAIDYVLARYNFLTVLDIGAGQGLHAQHFRNAGKFVVTIDNSGHWGEPDVRRPFLEYLPEEQFDLVWCSHVLEHQINVNLFLRKIFEVLKPGGVFAITVPPLRTHIVGGHVSVWNAGLLAYNLILANFDCRDLAVKQYGYNISVIGRKRYAVLPDLHMDRGDIEKLAHFFPFPVHQKFDGNVGEANWHSSIDARPVAAASVSAGQLRIDPLRSTRNVLSDVDCLTWAATCMSISGTVLEFGVYRGRTLRSLAEALPDRKLFGFDSFTGLPEPWVRSDTSTYQAGHFRLKGVPTDFPQNVSLVRGFFEDTLRLWRSLNTDQVALLHIDSDLYSAAKHVLSTLNDRLVPGTVVVFDELCDWKESGIYPAWREGEWKALVEWTIEHDRDVRLLARGENFSAAFVVVR